MLALLHGRWSDARWGATLREEERGSRERCTAVTATVLCMAPRPGRPKRGEEGEGAKQNGACSPTASVTYMGVLSSHMSSSMRDCAAERARHYLSVRTPLALTKTPKTPHISTTVGPAYSSAYIITAHDP